MNLASLVRSLSLIALISLLAACASSGHHGHGNSSTSRSPSLAAQRMMCALNPDECMYQGPYEAGEEAYAEEEAKRLNRDSLNRLRRSGRRF
ncbi:MAG TPA: hypothetical protein VK082_01335 [Paenalcaligenes sp.]|nr:hypothetical protein [Paenalcaligenes sp.]